MFHFILHVKHANGRPTKANWSDGGERLVAGKYENAKR